MAAWIESNILLQLASAPFDKQDETLVPEAGSCANCPKRTGFNKLLFPDVRKDSCTSPDCFRAKIGASVKKTLETKPQLIQISAAWNSREGAPLGRNQYVELEIKKPKANGASTKLSANQKPCEKMAEAILMDGGKRGQVVKVCADPACRVHHPNTPSPQQVERERAEERKLVQRIRELLVAPYPIERAWNYGIPNERFTCWTILEHHPSNTGIAFCSQGFGPSNPWGLVFLAGQHMGIGMDSAWFASLEDAMRESAAWDGPKPDVLEAR